MPNDSIPKVSGVRNWSAASFEPTAKPKKIVTMLINEFCTTSLSLSTTKDSLIKFPKQNMPISGAALGSIMPTKKN